MYYIHYILSCIFFLFLSENIFKYTFFFGIQKIYYLDYANSSSASSSFCSLYPSTASNSNIYTNSNITAGSIRSGANSHTTLVDNSSESLNLAGSTSSLGVVSLRLNKSQQTPPLTSINTSTMQIGGSSTSAFTKSFYF